MFSMGRASIGSCKIIIIFVLLSFLFPPHPCSSTSEGNVDFHKRKVTKQSSLCFFQ